MTRLKTIRWGLLATCCVLAPLLVAQTTDERRTQPTVVYIVRHAEKIDETPDADLSPDGFKRAEVLKWMLRDVAIDAVFSTTVPRTMHTVEPIAKANGLTVENYDPGTGELTEKIRHLGGGRTILVAGHSNTIPVSLKSLGAPIEEKNLTSFDNLFVVTLGGTATNAKGATLQRLHYPGRR